MITWITTVGWSPFAVINPIWAYCKEYDETPNRIIMIYTPFERIIQNLKICRRYISEILAVYNSKSLKASDIITEEIKNDNIDLYADKLTNIIVREKQQKPDKIILDMTPGRKYMSAINVYFGYNLKNIPIQVLYLHLEESKYQDVPYPLTPIIKNELIDILESTEIFSSDSCTLPEISLQDENIENEEYFIDEETKKDYLILLSIENEFNSKTKIRKYMFGNQVVIRSHELVKMLKSLISRDLINENSVLKNNQKYKIFTLTNKGKNKLMEFNHNIKKDKQGEY